MKKISKVEKTILQMNDRNKYDTYRCDEHGIYQIRKDVPESERKCLYCKKKHTKLTDEEIDELIKK